MDTDTILTGVAAAPFIAALISLLWKPFVADHRTYPIIAILLGVAYECGAKGQDVNGLGALSWFAAIILGATTGIAASGLYSGATTMVPAIKTLEPGNNAEG